MWKNILHSNIPQQAATLWNADKGSLKFIHSGIHLVYYFQSEGKEKYLRIAHPNLRNEKEIASAIDFQGYLFQQGIPACPPFLSKHNHYIEKLFHADKIFLAHVVGAVPGKPVFPESEQNDPILYKTWGKTLAQLHQASQKYQPKKRFQFKTWENAWDEISRYIPFEEPIIQTEYFCITDFFKSLAYSPINFGLTHNDHHSDNVLYDGKQIYIIDFDFPLYHWFMADIIRPFLPICHKNFSAWKNKFGWYLQGYESILPIDKIQIKFAPWFIRMKALEMYLWTKNNWKETIAPGGGSTCEWLNKIRKMVVNPQLAEWF